LQRLKRLVLTNTALVKDGVTKGTNLYDTLRAALEREANNRVQGVVVFTDGRTTESSPQGLADLKRLAQTRNVPLFVVGVGEDRQRVKIEVLEVQAEPQVRPDDRFRVAVDVTGEGLLGQKVDVKLELTRVRKGKDGKEEELELELAEEEGKDAPKDS